MIQIDIPMPKNCGECPICNEYLMCGVPCNGRGWGENDVSDYFTNGRPEWCPLKEQPQIIRCKDCKHYIDNPGYCAYDRIWQENKGHVWGMYCEPDWFCADGERKE